MSDNQQVNIKLHQLQDYRFEVRFSDGVPSMETDEPAPLGSGAGPSPVQLLVTAVGNCLTDSLLFALRKFKQQAEPIVTDARGVMGRNADGRLRVMSIEVSIRLGVAAAEIDRLERILGQFESFCTVTQSVAQGLPVLLQVSDSSGAIVHKSEMARPSQP